MASSKPVTQKSAHFLIVACFLLLFVFWVPCKCSTNSQKHNGAGSRRGSGSLPSIVDRLQRTAHSVNENVFSGRHGALRERLGSLTKTVKVKGKKATVEKNTKPLQKLNAESGYDTISLRLTRQGQILVTGNVKTRVVGDSLPTGKQKNNMFPDRADWGIQDSDHPTILNTIRSDSVLSAKPILIVETEAAAGNDEENAAPHAEMKAQKWRDAQTRPARLKNWTVGKIKNLFRPSASPDTSFVGTSKAACEKCSPVLAKAGVPHNSEGGLASDKVRNFDPPSKIGPLKGTLYKPGSVKPKLVKIGKSERLKPIGSSSRLKKIGGSVKSGLSKAWGKTKTSFAGVKKIFLGGRCD